MSNSSRWRRAPEKNVQVEPEPEPEYRGRFDGYFPGMKNDEGDPVFYSDFIRYPPASIVFEPGGKKSRGEYRTLIDPFRPSGFKSGKAVFKEWFLRARQHMTDEPSIKAAETLLKVRRWDESHAMFAVDLIAETYRPYYENEKGVES